MNPQTLISSWLSDGHPLSKALLQQVRAFPNGNRLVLVLESEGQLGAIAAYLPHAARTIPNWQLFEGVEVRLNGELVFQMPVADLQRLQLD